ncbi:MAG TPA: YetF domain-containing protein [Fimbriimonas sp.]|nr:YetF domain-containing protein [Fimbriimonas sp.]
MHALLLIAASTGIIYAFLIVAMRALGRHPMAQLSPLDLVVVMLLGSAVETSMVHSSTALSGGVVAAVVLLALNRLLTFGMLKSKQFKNLVGGGPLVLVSNGRFVEEHLKRAGLTKADVEEALRQRECGDLNEVRLAVLEPDGQVNVVFAE